ncbi:MAG: S49 family peptidase [Burkholderiaceae bacterium]|nr:S49 family peptidase [Burkholderiaceae bacterium]
MNHEAHTSDNQPIKAGGDPYFTASHLEGFLMATLREQRASRRWKIFFRLAFFLVFLAFTIGLFLDPRAQKTGTGPHTALINLEGEIALESPASAKDLNKALQAAFENSNTKGVILRINSPGGSPVQSSMVFNEIRRLRALHPQIPLYVVVEELCASGAYFIAAAADKIYVNPASLIGSIGVLMNGFGLTEIMKKTGVERRLLTAGENKGMLDPFSPLSDKHRDHVQAMLSDIHTQFITAVKQGRGKRLVNAEPEIFSGLIYTGSKGVAVGLADEFGSVDSVAREVIQAPDLMDFSPHENVAERLAKKLGASFGVGLVQAITNKGVTLR